MKVTTPGLVPVYTVSGAATGRPLPDWLARRRKRSLKNDPEYSNRVELLQDVCYVGFGKNSSSAIKANIKGISSNSTRQASASESPTMDSG